ncbi:hypothetical protein H072_4643 [Dactylellina haptotyla CBS 200.50]|uniref:NAD(P)-binding domain-containing protein n=1 Tax=Dactylellina haptotyla (strain CBS 200.50) TaxID=1284197 RepID=S8AEK5_DACHA|nr:hypothetical protein H072_4643 [Dactylellina haptotyla CBS 200.50]
MFIKGNFPSLQDSLALQHQAGLFLDNWPFDFIDVTRRSMPRFLFIGGTGHIGGAVLDKFLKDHPEESVQVKVLVRSNEKSKRLLSKYPGVQPIIGSFGEPDKLRALCREADVVVNTAPDVTHDEDIKAILRGLNSRSQNSYYIHTSGAALVWDEPTGNKDARMWDDISDITALRSFPDWQTHATTDRLVRESALGTNIAIIAPGCVGGISPSIEHPTPITTPSIVLTARAFNSGYQIAQGENSLAWIHVDDLAKMYTILIDDALAALNGEPVKRPGGFELWGADAYYFGVGHNIPFRDFMKGLVSVLHKEGVIESTEIKSVNVTQAAQISLAGPDGEYDPEATPPPVDSWVMHIAVMYGINMRLRASRMEKLGWKAEKGPVMETFPEMIPLFLQLEKEGT